MQAIDNKVLSRIHGLGRGAVVIPSRFSDLGSRQAIDVTLHRLARRGTIRRIARGVYDYPIHHPDLGILSPNPDAVAKALAGRDKTRLQPSGAYAANLLGLSTQVPAKIVYLTDGRSRTVKIGNTKIQLRQTTPKNMAAAGRVSGLVIQALRHLGKNHIDQTRIDQLKRTLSLNDRSQLLRDISLAPTWMHPILRKIAE